jgi:tRNA(Met) C34 N-acetyltransferase TmcA
MQRGQLDLDKAGQFSLFLETSDITYCLYRDSERVLGNTFGMCILQVLLQAPVYTVAIVVMVLAVC